MQIEDIEVIKHFFLEDTKLYFKLVRIPMGYHVLTHKHTFSHASILVKGCAIVDCDGNRKVHYAPDIIEIKAGVAHEIIAVNGEVDWICAHSLANIPEENWKPDKIDVELIES